MLRRPWRGRTRRPPRESGPSGAGAGQQRACPGRDGVQRAEPMARWSSMAQTSPVMSRSQVKRRLPRPARVKAGTLSAPAMIGCARAAGAAASSDAVRMAGAAWTSCAVANAPAQGCARRPGLVDAAPVPRGCGEGECPAAVAIAGRAGGKDGRAGIGPGSARSASNWSRPLMRRSTRAGPGGSPRGGFCHSKVS